VDTGKSPTPQSEKDDHKTTRFVGLWTTLVMTGLTFEFLGRFFGYVGNPSPLYHPVVSALVGIVAILLILSGVFVFDKGRKTRRDMTRRKGLMLLVLGGAMLVGFFVFKQVVPRIFG
jgi:hypothetical protein